MAVSLATKDFWVFSPYCFCQNREWLSVTQVLVDGGPGTPTPWLADDDALLVALLTALALFLLLLLLLLLCCLCRRELCCCCCPPGKGGGCACCGGKGGKGGKSSSKEDLAFWSEGSSGSINLTALDMKIPRAWMDEKDSKAEAEKTASLPNHNGNSNNISSLQGQTRHSLSQNVHACSDQDRLDGNRTSEKVQRKAGKSFEEESLSQSQSQGLEGYASVNKIRDESNQARYDDLALGKSRSWKEEGGEEGGMGGGGGVCLGNASGRDVSSYHDSRNASRSLGRQDFFMGEESFRASVRKLVGESVESTTVTKTKGIDLPGATEKSSFDSRLDVNTEDNKSCQVAAFPSVTALAPYEEIQCQNQVITADGNHAMTSSEMVAFRGTQDHRSSNQVQTIGVPSFPPASYRKVYKTTKTTTTTTTVTK